MSKKELGVALKRGGLDFRLQKGRFSLRLHLLYHFSPGKKFDGMHRKVCIAKKPMYSVIDFFKQVSKFFSGPYWNCPSSIKMLKSFDYHQCERLFFSHFEAKIMPLAIIGVKIFLKGNPPFLAKSLVLGKKGQ